MDRRTDNDNMSFFIAFCTELYKKAHSLTGKEAYERLAESGAIEYLEHNYEPIHTQSPGWILEEIEDFIASQKT